MSVKHEKLFASDYAMRTIENDFYALHSIYEPKRSQRENDINYSNVVVQPAFLDQHSQNQIFHTGFQINVEALLKKMIREGRQAETELLLYIMKLRICSEEYADIEAFKHCILGFIDILSQTVYRYSFRKADAIQFAKKYRSMCIMSTDKDAALDCIDRIIQQFVALFFNFSTMKHQVMIQKLFSYVQAHLTEKITLDEIAEHVHFSKSHICKILKTELGCTFTEYVNNVRIQQSKFYLENTSFTVAEIANMVGINEHSYFTRIFKRNEGMTPSMYREKYRCTG